jgi:hypothetical protein
MADLQLGSGFITIHKKNPRRGPPVIPLGQADQNGSVEPNHLTPPSLSLALAILMATELPVPPPPCPGHLRPAPTSRSPPKHFPPLT